MAFENHSFANYETLVPLSLEYSKEAVSPPSGSWSSDVTFKYSRRATKTYVFRGMSESAAQKCLAEKRRQYMRRFVAWRWQGATMVRDSMSKDYYEQVAQFNVSKREVVYDVQITVDETVCMYSTKDFNPVTEQGCKHIEGLFNSPGTIKQTWVPTYSYDEPGGR